MNNLKKNFPEDLKTVVEDWKSGNYIPNRIQDGYDIFKNVNQGKNSKFTGNNTKNTMREENIKNHGLRREKQ